MVSVSQEALSLVKSALKDFSTDINGISHRSNSIAEELLAQGKGQIRATQDEVNELEVRINYLINEINSLEEEIEQCEHEIYHLREDIDQMYHNIRLLEDNAARIRSKVLYLRSELSGIEDPDNRDQVKAQIAALEENEGRIQEEIKKQRSMIHESENQMSRLQEKINDDKRYKDKMSIDLDDTKKRCSRMKDKLQKQKFEFTRVESYLNDYIHAVKKFEASSGNAASQSSSAVDLCIASIEEYLSVDL